MFQFKFFFKQIILRYYVWRGNALYRRKKKLQERYDRLLHGIYDTWGKCGRDLDALQDLINETDKKANQIALEKETPATA